MANFRNLLDEMDRLVGALTEMPHIDYHRAVGPAWFGIVDFQIEKYPLSPAEKTELMRALQKDGVVAKSGSRWIYFGPNGDLSKATPEQIATLKQLPKFWESYLINVD